MGPGVRGVGGRRRRLSGCSGGRGAVGIGRVGWPALRGAAADASSNQRRSGARRAGCRCCRDWAARRPDRPAPDACGRSGLLRHRDSRQRPVPIPCGACGRLASVGDRTGAGDAGVPAGPRRPRLTLGARPPRPDERFNRIRQEGSAYARPCASASERFAQSPPARPADEPRSAPGRSADGSALFTRPRDSPTLGA